MEKSFLQIAEARETRRKEQEDALKQAQLDADDPKVIEAEIAWRQGLLPKLSREELAEVVGVVLRERIRLAQLPFNRHRHYSELELNKDKPD